MSDEPSIASKGGTARAAALSPEARTEIARKAAQTRWGAARQHLVIPLLAESVASIPFPMTDEDFQLLLDTLILWKPKLVRPTVLVLGESDHTPV